MTGKKGMRPVLALVLVVALTTAVVGCGPAEDDPAPDPSLEPGKGGHIVIAQPSPNVPAPDVHDASNIGDLCGASMMAEPLVLWKDEAYHGALAESWDISEDGLEYTFHIRPGVKFHNGVTLTAQHVVDNIDRITNPDDPRYAAGQFANVVDYEVVGDTSVKLTLGGMDPDFLAKLLVVWIQEPGSWQSGPHPVGTGPFKVAEYVEDERLVLERFDDYWDGPANLDGVTFRGVPDSDTQVLELETGGIDFILFAPPREGQRLEGMGFNVMPFGRVNWARVAFNMTTVTDIHVRRAVSYAIDREALINVAYAGYGEPMESLTVPGSWAHDPDAPGFYYDPAKAKKVLDDAGYVDTTDDGIREIAGKPITLHLPVRGDDEAWLRATQMIQQMLFDVGIGTQITTAARMSYYTAVRTGDYDITLWLSNAAAEPPVAFGNLDSNSYWNVSQYPKDHPVQQKIDELIVKGRSTLDFDERAGHYQQLNQLVYEEAVEAFCFWLRQIYIVRPDLKGIFLAPSGIIYETHKWYLGE